MLKRVKIQGYKSLVDVEVYLQPLTVLFGPNASGKSNFLDALQLLSSIATSRTLKDAFSPPYRGTPLESFTFGPLGIKDLLARERVSFSVEVDIELSQAIVDKVNQEIRAVRGTKTVAEGNKTDSGSNVSYVREKYLRYRIEIEMLPKSGALRIANESLTVLDARYQSIQGSVSENPGDSSILSTPAYRYHSGLPYLVAMREELASWYFFYLEPRERMRFPTPVREVRHIGLMGEELAAFLNTLRALDERQFKAVEKALHMIIPSFTGIDVSVNNFGEVELSLMQGQTPIPARVLSEGTLRILGLLALGGAKESPSLLGFEEPENGIHPDRLDLVVLLLKTLTSNDTQVIATTHSPTLLDLIPGESLYVCRQINGSTNISPLSTWRTIEETRSVSERLLRGDFNA
jgi:predicted ATPase